jgi:hypothetical protein
MIDQLMLIGYSTCRPFSDGILTPSVEYFGMGRAAWHLDGLVSTEKKQKSQKGLCKFTDGGTKLPYDQ